MIKPLFIALALGLAASPQGFSQVPTGSPAQRAAVPAPGGPVALRPTPAKMAAEALELILAQVDQLADGQKTKIAAVLDQAAAQGQALIETTSLSKGERGLKMIELRDRTAGSVRSILTAAQKGQFDAVVRVMTHR
jgi:hypothetical protein